MRVRRIGKNEQAVSPVIGGVSMVGMTVIMVTVVAASVFGFALPADTPWARIVIRDARGNDNIFDGNEIVLIHKGGEALYPDKVKIIIRGEGKEAPKEAYCGGSCIYNSGNIMITYNDLSGYNYVNSIGKRKDHYFFSTSYDTYIEFAKIIQGDAWSSGTTHEDSWSAGEKIILYGADGSQSNHINNVDKKWKLNPGSTVTVTLIDSITNEIITVTSATVTQSSSVVGT